MEIKGPAKMVYSTIFEISEAEADRLIDKKEPYECDEKQLFIVRKKDQIVAIDNTTDGCYVQTFSSESDAYIWLLNLKDALLLKNAEEKLIEWR